MQNCQLKQPAQCPFLHARLNSMRVRGKFNYQHAVTARQSKTKTDCRKLQSLFMIFA